jgi:hypothetical protein
MTSHESPALALLLGLAAFLACCTTSKAAGGSVEVALTPEVHVALPPGWKVLPSNLGNVVTLGREEQDGGLAARVTAMRELRTDHAEAVRRLGEVAKERPGERTFLALCGWPALERRYSATQRRPEGPAGKPFQPVLPEVDTLEIVIAAGPELLYLRGESLGSSAALDEVAALARTLRCPNNPHPESTATELKTLTN